MYILGSVWTGERGKAFIFTNPTGYGDAEERRKLRRLGSSHVRHMMRLRCTEDTIWGLFHLLVLCGVFTGVGIQDVAFLL
jgi:hypothetical protein